MSPQTIRRWSVLHRWSSLLCTLFMLLLCVTGLPLIFREEIDQALTGTGTVAAATPARSLEEVVATGSTLQPDRVVQFIVWEPETPGQITLSMAATATAYPSDNISVLLDAATGEPVAGGDAGIMELVLKLHGQLLLGPAGPPLLGLIAIAFLLSLLSGIVLYAPFMRRLPFGAVRRDRGVQVRRLDWHNLLGIVTAAWLLVVGGTGWINAWGGYIFQIWQVTAMAPTPPDAVIRPPLVSAGAALQTALAALPGHAPAIIAMPGSLMSDPGHYAIYLRGGSALESRLMRAVLVDTQNGVVASVPDIPWYITGLLLSQPLHFGDYGGLALKLLWAVLDLVAIAVLWTGLRLWWRGRGVA
ncbi:PepSY-associated TM helix domain-containing protein [Niveispirillum sp. KHB5.9]|uniref:PepSY-associated TM helix domain-containing protein n=1 Tax=Niveispirillum sp. KHB5.9 TaxID=3400269 RepID=UPI003A859ADE